MTKSSNRPQKVLTRRRLASSQRETSKLLALNVSVAWHSVPAQFHWCTSQWIPRRLWTKHHECDVYTRKEVYANVVLSSGTTILQGSREHMTRIDGVGATHDEFSSGCSPPERKFGIDLSLSLQKMWASRFDSERYL